MTRHTRFTCGIAVLLCAAATSALAVSVGNYTALINAIANGADGDTITLTNNITVSATVSISLKALTIEGNQHTISVPVPGLNELGVINTNSSPFRVFDIFSSGKTNTLRNMTIHGGSLANSGGGGIRKIAGTLVLEGITLSRSTVTNFGGGGLYNVGGTMIMRDCHVSRNAAGYGGGFLNDSTGSLFIERSTFSDNRSLFMNGGGGAGENQYQCNLFANNSTFANNICAELGGAINNYQGTSTFVNCTFVGNLAFGTVQKGGAIANNNGSVTMVNSLFAYNYQNTGSAYVLNDLEYLGPSAPVAYACIFQSTTNKLSTNSTATILYAENGSGSNNTLFCSGTTNRATGPDGTPIGSLTLYQPTLAKIDTTKTPAALLKSGSFAFGKGVRTAFSSATSTQVVGYYNGSAWVTLSGSDPASHEITTDQNGVARGSSNTVGAVVTTATDLFLLKVNSATNGTVFGGTLYGDSYPSGTSVTLTAIPSTGYQLSTWHYVLGGSGVASTLNPYTLSLTTNVTLLPEFNPASPVITIPPTNQAAAVGGTIQLSVTAASVVPMSYQWFKNGAMVSGATNNELTKASAGVTDSGVYYVAITNAGGLSISTPVTVTVGTPQLLAWGYNGDGQLGNGTFINRSNAVSIANLVISAAAGNTHSLYLKSDGTLWATGYNYYGQLGNGTTVTRSNAVSVASNVVSVIAGADHTLFLKNDGTLWAMGWNGDGELGDGTHTQRNSPVSVASNVVAMAGGAWHSLYLKNDGILWAMGQNNSGQLGDGTTVSRSNAVAVASNVVAIAAGADHCLYLKDNGTLWTMGSNQYGQLGDGTMINRSNAVSVASNVVAMAGGNTHSLYVKNDGTLWAMGRNNFGQLGAGGTSSRSNAVMIASAVAAVTAGNEHSLFLKNDGTLWAMGWNYYGQLGDGTTATKYSPVSVPGMALANIISGNYAYHTLAVGLPLPPSITSQPTNLHAYFGSNVTFSVMGTGVDPLAYQWYFNGGLIGGATAKNYTVTGVSTSTVGNYTVVLSNPGGSVTSSVAVLSFTKAMASVSLSGLSQTYDGSPKSAGATPTPGGLMVIITYDGSTTIPTNAGSYAVTGTVDDVHWQGSTNGTLTIDKAAAAVTLQNLAQTYNGSPRSVTATTTPDSLSVSFTYEGSPTAPTNAGSYAVTGTVSEINWQGSTNGILSVSKATADVALHGLVQICDGSPKSVTATTIPGGLAVTFTYNGSPIAPTDVGSYAVTGTVNDVNWQGSANGTLIIKTAQTISFAGFPPQPLTGSIGLAATASSGLPVSFSVRSGPGSISGSTNLTFTTPGTVIVLATQAGDDTYGAAPDVTNRVYVYAVTPNNGPFAGGNTVIINDGNLGTITNVRVAGVVTAIQAVDTNGVTVIVPATGSAGVKDIVIQTSDNGNFTLTGAYTVNPAGQIGSSMLVPHGWTGLSSGLSGSAVNALAHDGTYLYAAGDFLTAGGVAANRVALWNGASWTNLGSGLSGGVAYDLAHDGTNLYAGGDFTNAGGVAVNYVALWNGTSWTNLGSGLNGTVRALVCDDANLYAGGSFTNAGGLTANYVARWNGTSWTNLGTGLSGTVRALVHDGTNLYAGGTFTTAGGGAANYVARWNGTSWANLGSGMNNTVTALAHDGTTLYAGGDFTMAGGVAANFVALWNGTSWTNLGTGVNDSITALACAGTNLYAGGHFSMAGGVPAYNIAAWTGTEWTGLDGGMSDLVRALAHDGTNLYAGGNFMTAGGGAANRVAMWGPTVIALSGVAPASGALDGGYTVTISGTNLCNGLDVTNVTLCGIPVLSIESQSDTQIVVIAGMAAATGLGNVRVYSTSFGETLKSNAFTYLADQTISFAAIAPQPVAGTVGLTATSSSGLPVSFSVLSGSGAITNGTNLTFTAPGTVTIVASQAGNALFGAARDVTNRIPVYTVSPDSGPLAGGNTVTISIGSPGAITNVQVGGVSAAIQNADANGLTLIMPATGLAGLKDIVIQTADNGDFLLTSVYTVNPAGQIGGTTPGPHVWAGLGSDLAGSFVFALAHAGTNLYAGGSFSIAGGIAANAANWDGLSWTNLGSGMDDSVTALAFDGTNLFAGGYFTTAGGGAANYVAMWNGTSWTNLGSGLDGPVSALVSFGGKLYAGGTFTMAGGVAASRVAMWNGTNWTGLGSGMFGSYVTALAHDGTNLYAGGEFTKAGGVAANRVARWNGTSWTNLGSGMNGAVFALNHDGSKLYAGGDFTTADGVGANYVARWNGTIWTGLSSGMNGTVRALTHNGTNLYAGGNFTVAGGTAANYVAHWNGTAWTNLDSGVNSWVRALTHDGTNLYAGGYFSIAGGTAAIDVAVWKPSLIVHDSVTPDSGALTGGYQVVISGVNLGNGSDVTSVTICGIGATIQSQSATQIIVTAGAAVSAGLGDVHVFSSSFGETVKSNAFTYIAAIPPWNPQIQSGGNFGIWSNQFGFTITGDSNLVVIVEACTNLTLSVWSPVETQMLTEGVSYFYDPNWTNYPSRFYRLSMP